MATIDTNIKKGQYLKKTGADSYVHYHFDTDDSIVYLIDNLNRIQEGGEVDSSHYAKGTTLHETLCALYTLASKGGQASTDLATLITKVDKHIKNVNNPHSVNKGQVGLGSVINAPMDNEPIGGSPNYVKSGGVYTAVRNVNKKADEAISIANGKSRAYVFANVNAVMTGTLSNNQSISGYKVGDSIYIISTDVSDFWISAIASTGTISPSDVIRKAKKGDTVVVNWGSSYVSLTAFESKRDLNGYVTTDALNTKLNDYYNKKWIEKYYVPYSGANNDINLGDHILTVTDGALTNPKAAEISKGEFRLCGETIVGDAASWRGVYITVNGIRVGDTIFDYPHDTTSGTLATREFVTGKGYQTETQVDKLIKRTSLTFGGDIIGGGLIGNQPIELRLTDMADLPTADTTFSAVKVNKQGRVIAGAQQIVFAHTINDSDLNNLAINGVAIVDVL